MKEILVPTYLVGFVKEKNVVKEVLSQLTLCSSKGNELLEVWYYGDLFNVSGEDQPYIVPTKTAPEKIVAKDPATGEEFLIFDGAKYGYEALFCEEFDSEAVKNRQLTKYDIPASKLIFHVAYNIDYEDEKEEYDVDEDNNVTLIDGSTISWDDVKQNGFDYVALYFINEKGEKVQFFDHELA